MTYGILSIVKMSLPNLGRIAEGRTIRSEIHTLFNSISNREKLSETRKDSIMVPIYKKGDKTNCSKYRGTSIFPATFKVYPASCSQV